jgi:hypothetical protein
MVHIGAGSRMAMYSTKTGWIAAVVTVAIAAGCGKTWQREPVVGIGQPETPVQLDMSAYYQSKGRWSDPNSKSDFRAFGGRHTIDGLPFSVENMAVLYGQSWGRGRRTEPNDVIGVKVGRKFDELHLIHMASWPDVEGASIATIRLNYQDGSKAELPIIYGGHVRDWNRTAAEESEGLSEKDSKICWRGATVGNKNPRLFKSMLANPHPGRVVGTIDVVSTRSLSSYRLCAATTAMHDGSRAMTPAVSPAEDRRFDGKLTLHVVYKATQKPLKGVLVQSTMAFEGNPQAAGQPLVTTRSGDAVIRYPAGKLKGGSISLSKAGYCTISQSGNDVPPDTTITVEMEIRDPEKLYANYDKQFQSYLATAVKLVGKQTMKLEPLSSKYSVPKKLTVDATPYELGLTIGYIAKQAGAKLPMITDPNRAVNREMVTLYKRIYPEYLGIIGGVAEVYRVKLEDIDLRVFEHHFVMAMWCNLLQYGSFFQQTDFGVYGNPNPEPAHSCSVASYYDGTNQIVGRNFDNPSDRPHYMTTTHMDGCYDVVGHTIYGLNTWVTDSINEKGLCLSGATNGGKYFLNEPFPNEPAIVCGQMMRIVMDKCATVDEAVALIGSVRVWFPDEGNHWLLADASGKSVVIEWDMNKKMVVLDRKGPWELITNSALQMGDPNVVKECWRYRKAMPRLEAGVHGTGQMLDLMNGIRSNTLWMSVMDLNARRIEVHYFKEFNTKYEFALPSRTTAEASQPR